MSERGHQLLKLWPVGSRAGDLLAENPLATSSLELGSRAGEVLRFRRDAGVTVNHARIVHQNYASEKPNCIRGLGLIQIS